MFGFGRRVDAVRLSYIFMPPTGRFLVDFLSGGVGGMTEELPEPVRAHPCDARTAMQN